MDQKEQIIQYILVRSDLGWSTGSIIAQACHARLVIYYRIYILSLNTFNFT